MGCRRQPRRRGRRPARRGRDHLDQLAVHLLDQRSRRRSSPCSSGSSIIAKETCPAPRSPTSTSPAPSPSSAASPPWSTPSARPPPTAGGRPAPSTGLVVVRRPAVAFLKLERRAAKPLFPPHVWKLDALVSGTAVMLGVTGLLVGAVFLTSIFLQTVLGYSALRTGVAFLPFALAITAGTVVARHLLAPPLPARRRRRRPRRRRRRRRPAVHRRQPRTFAGDLLPGLVALGLGVGMVFVPVSVTSMAGIPSSHAGVASGLPDDRPRGRRRAGCGRPVRGRQHRRLADRRSTGPPPRFSRGFICAAVIALVFAAFAMWRMPASASPAPSATCTTERVADPATRRNPAIRPVRPSRVRDTVKASTHPPRHIRTRR